MPLSGLASVAARLAGKPVTRSSMATKFGKPTELTKEQITRFEEIGDLQRGSPEMAMREGYEAMGGGVLPYMLENIGDISNRMTIWPHKASPYRMVKPKVYTALKEFEHPYEFEKKLTGDIQTNYNHKYPKPKTKKTAYKTYEYRDWEIEKIDSETVGEPTYIRWQMRPLSEDWPTDAANTLRDAKADIDRWHWNDYVEKINKSLENYAEAHSKLPAYNRAQYLARETAVALGKKDFDRVRKLLRMLKSIVNDRQTFELATRIDIGPPGRKVGGMIERNPYPYEARAI